MFADKNEMAQFVRDNNVMDKSKRLGAEIKNRLNPYIYDRVSRLDDGQIITDDWMDVVEAGCQALIQDLGVRKSLAREHMVSYILQEFGIEIFGVKPNIAPVQRPDVDAVVKRLKKELHPTSKKTRSK